MVIQCLVVWKCQATEPDYQPRLHSCMNYRLDKPDCLIKLFFFELIIFESFNLFNLIRLRFFFLVRSKIRTLSLTLGKVCIFDVISFWSFCIENVLFWISNVRQICFFHGCLNQNSFPFAILMTDCHDFRMLSIAIKIGNHSKFIGMNVASEMYRSR